MFGAFVNLNLVAKNIFYVMPLDVPLNNIWGVIEILKKRLFSIYPKNKQFIFIITIYYAMITNQKLCFS